MKNKFLVGILVLPILLGTVAHAATLDTYAGTGIRGWYSVDSFNVTKGYFYVDHNNIRWNQPVGQQMDIQAMQSVWYGYETKGIQSTYGTGWTYNLTFTVPNGTYKLYFHAPIDPAAADIEGTVRD